MQRIVKFKLVVAIIIAGVTVGINYATATAKATALVRLEWELRGCPNKQTLGPSGAAGPTNVATSMLITAINNLSVQKISEKRRKTQ